MEALLGKIWPKMKERLFLVPPSSAISSHLKEKGMQPTTTLSNALKGPYPDQVLLTIWGLIDGQ